MLHTNTEFGRRAEVAFREQLNPSLKDKYVPLQFSIDNQTSTNDLLNFILRERPEVLAVFGNAEDVKYIDDNLKLLRTGVFPYHPLLLTILDVRDLQIEGLHFSSAVRDSTIYNHNNLFTDARCLSHDTFRLVMTTILDIGIDNAINKPELIRDSLHAWMNEIKIISPLPTDHTILFDNSEINLFKIENSEVSAITIIPTPPWYKRLVDKVLLLRQTHGYWPYIFTATLVQISFFGSSILFRI